VNGAFFTVYFCWFAKSQCLQNTYEYRCDACLNILLLKCRTYLYIQAYRMDGVRKKPHFYKLFEVQTVMYSLQSQQCRSTVYKCAWDKIFFVIVPFYQMQIFLNQKLNKGKLSFRCCAIMRKQLRIFGIIVLRNVSSLLCVFKSNAGFIKIGPQIIEKKPTIVKYWTYRNIRNH